MPEPLKNEINKQTVSRLAQRFGTQCAQAFDASKFATAVNAELDSLELKDRINLIADQIHANLALDYPTALDAVVAVSQSEISEWAAWPLCSFVERHGLAHPEQSLAAMEELTKAWSCEFAIRPYLENNLELSRTYLREWAQSESEHVRRLPSEGTRPRLPWGPKVAALVEDPTIGIELLDQLCRDESETVRRSVANHLNDIAKVDAKLVVDTLIRWERPVGSADSDPLDAKMVRHALRTLVKDGYPGALQLLGLTTDPEVEVESFTCNPELIELGTAIELETTFTSTSDDEQKLVVDFVVHHVTARGTTLPKVFKWKTISLAAGESVKLSKARMIKNASTRTYHAGEHRLDLQVAGHTLASSSFTIAI